MEFRGNIKSIRVTSAWICVVFALWSQESLAQAQSNLDSLLRVISITPDDTHKVNSLLDLSKQLSQAYPNKETIKYAELALGLAQKLNAPSHIASAYREIGWYWQILGNHTEALHFYQLALAIREDMDDLSGIAILHFYMGFNYKQQNLYDKALEHYQAALNIAEKLGYKKLIADIYQDLAFLYEAQSNTTTPLGVSSCFAAALGGNSIYHRDSRAAY